LIRLITEPVRRDDTREPCRVFHDWRDGQLRRELWEAFFSGFGRFELREKPKVQIPHARALTLTWEDGTIWVLRMDQGVGYWRVGRGASGRFPFQRGVEDQLDRLRKANLIVEGDVSGHPTFWYCGQHK
jgi:DEAD/DEAH box helicase domain-containing protein